MPNCFSSRLRGSGLASGPRGRGVGWLLFAFFGLTLSGCATKGDLRDLKDEIQALAAQQRAAMGQAEGLNLAVQDTLRGQSDALFQSRGEIVRLLRQIEQQLITLQELTGQNQRALAALRDLTESRRPAVLPPVRTDPEGGGQVLDVEFEAEPQATGAAVETYNAAIQAFNRGSVSTARRAFQQFLREYPNDSLAPDAHYYLADLLVQEDRLDEAIQAFLRIPELFPTAEKVPDSLYRVGVVYILLDDLENARLYLERVINSYPGTTAAQAAQDRLDGIS
jgi:tol-pal system protein YbgF